jgi:hypothetical protein
MGFCHFTANWHVPTVAQKSCSSAPGSPARVAPPQRRGLGGNPAQVVRYMLLFFRHTTPHRQINQSSWVRAARPPVNISLVSLVSLVSLLPSFASFLRRRRRVFFLAPQGSTPLGLSNSNKFIYVIHLRCVLLKYRYLLSLMSLSESSTL